MNLTSTVPTSEQLPRSPSRPAGISSRRMSTADESTPLSAGDDDQGRAPSFVCDGQHHDRDAVRSSPHCPLARDSAPPVRCFRSVHLPRDGGGRFDSARAIGAGSTSGANRRTCAADNAGARRMKHHVRCRIRPPSRGRVQLSVSRWRRPRRRCVHERQPPVPPPTVVPVLVYPDVRAAVTFLTAAFGFVERTRIGESHRAQMAVGEDGAVVIADVGGDRRAPDSGGVSQVVRVRVADVATVHPRPRPWRHRGRGAGRQEYGERDCTLVDLAGHRWQLAEAVADVAPEEFGCETVSPWPAYRSGTSG